LPEGTCTAAAETSLCDIRVDVKEVGGDKPNAISVIVRGGDNLTGNDFADNKSRFPLAIVLELRIVLENGSVVSYISTPVANLLQREI
jgi:hypothetical protein